ncbi:DODA-type extradiol aromatic ring-opening family dioxygenase [Lentisalinibacter orientalis]|uniref:DODA-type extradiol aromatic ring-opening family dioxygenase n=1 Tax=Lentisalinibacter orientalis TaxID=2992241 RepID=UPI003867E46D
MANLVFGAATSHLAMVLNEPTGEETERIARFRAGFTRLREGIHDQAVDVLVVVSGEHINKFFLDNMPAFAVGMADSYWGPVEELPIEKRVARGTPSLSRVILETGLAGQIDWARVEEWDLDHGIMVPLHFLDPSADMSIVPIFVNTSIPPYPTLRRCREVGRSLRDAVTAWPEHVNVAIVACGGLSHSPGDFRMGYIDEAFDMNFLRLLEKPDLEAVVNMPEERIEAAGSSAGEIRAWVILAAAFEGTPLQNLLYEPISRFGTGCAQGLYRP